ncbi:hypothetical protein D9M70_447760 [compost metagenome]
MNDVLVRIDGRLTLVPGKVEYLVHHISHEVVAERIVPASMDGLMEVTGFASIVRDFVSIH